jgi:hypothetical protein
MASSRSRALSRRLDRYGMEAPGFGSGTFMVESSSAVRITAHHRRSPLYVAGWRSLFSPRRMAFVG